MRKLSRPLGGLAILGFMVLTAVTAASTEEFDSTHMPFARRAEALMMARCSVCHSADLVTQQRLPRDRWEATVVKMKHWGAQLSQEEEILLIRYLSARYHPGAPDRLPPLEPEVRPPAAAGQEHAPVRRLVGMAGRGAGIFENNCQACHGQSASGGVGPKLAKNPILKQQDLFWETVLHGRGPMPAWSTVLSEQDIADIHAWLLTR
jgi:cytochrome c oxidase cbb3-type subunit III